MRRLCSLLFFFSATIFALLPAFAADTPSPKVMVAPPFSGQPGGGGDGDYLSLVSTKTNKITDEAAWFTRNKINLSPYHSGRELLPRFADAFPKSYQGAPLLAVAPSGENVALIYGRDGAGRFVLLSDAKGRTFKTGFDFASWMRAPKTKSGDEGYVEQGLTWALVGDGVLYVSHAHRTYAESSMGMNAYIGAVEIKTGKVLWRSPALVSNARNFVLLKDVIVSGYGFTKEEDYVYVLDRSNGNVRQRLPVKSGPEYLVRKGAKLYVRCYNADVVLAVDPSQTSKLKPGSTDKD